jgi:hypothetical protein
LERLIIFLYKVNACFSVVRKKKITSGTLSACAEAASVVTDLPTTGKVRVFFKEANRAGLKARENILMSGLKKETGYKKMLKDTVELPGSLFPIPNI